MQELLEETQGSPPRFSFPDLLPPPPPNYTEQACSCAASELSSTTSTPFVSAPSSPTASRTAPRPPFYFTTAPTSPSHTHDLFDFPHLPPSLHHHPLHSTVPPSKLEAFSPRSSPNWAQQSLHAELNISSSWSQKSPQIITDQHHRTSSWAPQSLQTDQARSHSPRKSGSTNWAQHSLDSATEHNSPQKDVKTQHARYPLGSQASLQIKDLHTTQNPQPIITDLANHKLALKRLQVEDIHDASYSRKSFYASAVPFSWEEKPGTPKARSITSEASNGEDDSPSNLLSGSSEFEFSARFSELEDPPMSPTPISSPFNAFNNQHAYGSPSPTHKYTYCANPYMQNETANEEQIWPLRPPPRLNNPRLTKQSITDEANELKRSRGSLASAPQSPRSPRIFDLRGAFCGISSPVDAVFDPFLAAMEKSMAKNGDEEEMGKSPKKKTNRHSHGHHRRTQSLSPLRVFHWDDHSAESNSSSKGSSTILDEVKNKHPVQKEINARHSAAGTPKGSKRWSFKDFLHRKSISGGENARHSNTSASLRSSGRESCSSSGNGEGPMDPSMLASMPSTPSSILSPSSSNNSSKGKLNTNKGNKGPYALHYNMQRAQTEELRKKTFLPYKQGLLGCLGLSSKSYKALATLAKPLQSVS